MKTHIIISAFVLFSFSSFASNTKPAAFEKSVLVESEMNDILEHVLDVNEKQLISQLEKKNKIIIVDSNFNKIVEGSLNESGKLVGQNSIKSLINRSNFIVEIHNVSFYLLEKK